MVTMVILMALMIILIVGTLFFFSSKKVMMSKNLLSAFECGFSSYFYSRFSFSIHYYLIGLIFLFLDLELCCIMPYFNEETEMNNMFLNMMILVFIMLLGLIFEWVEGKLEWNL